MKKAGVDADFPADPINLEQLDPRGRHSFEATFTAAEVTALINLYRYGGSELPLSLESAAVQFPKADHATITGRASLGTSSYTAEVSGGFWYDDGSIVAFGPIEASVQGFRLTGSRRRQAVDQLLRYVNGMLDAAPGLTVLSAEVVKGGVMATGVAPDRLVNLGPDMGNAKIARAGMRER